MAPRILLPADDLFSVIKDFTYGALKFNRGVWVYAKTVCDLMKVPMVTTESGLQYKDIKVGSGPNPPVGFQVCMCFRQEPTFFPLSFNGSVTCNIRSWQQFDTILD